MSAAAAVEAADQLDGLEGELIETALTGTDGRSSDAVAALLTAGFTILIAAVGRDSAVGAMGSVVNAITSRLTN